MVNEYISKSQSLLTSVNHCSNQGYRDLQIILLDSVDSAALSRDSKIGSHWYWAEPGFADNSDINKTIEQPLSKN